jgi:hypothetical protein
MKAPFGSLDYLAALQFCVGQGAKVVIVDSMSHEHEGPGGMVDLHDQILDRMAGDDYGKRERVKMLAWSEPKQKRRQLINGILQLNANFIFCFRAKNTAKPIKGKNGKTEVEALGFMPIAGEEFVFEQTLNALLLPGAGGVPTWSSEQIGERTMIKLPEQFKGLAGRNAPLDEKVGASLARWAQGAERSKEDAEAEKTPERQFEATDTDPDEPVETPDEQPPAVNDRTLATELGLDDHPGQAKAGEIIAEIEAAGAIIDVNSIVARHGEDIEALPDDLQVKIEIAADQRKNAIKAEREKEPVK